MLHVRLQMEQNLKDETSPDQCRHYLRILQIDIGQAGAG